jgi:hypothetical protein
VVRRGRRYVLADLQAHYGIPGELVEGGQLYLVASPSRDRVQDDDRHDDRDERVERHRR